MDKEQIAKQCARLFTQQMSAAGVPADVQLMAVEMVARVIFISSVKEERRLEFFDKWSKQVRTGIKASTKETTNVKKRRH